MPLVPSLPKPELTRAPLLTVSGFLERHDTKVKATCLQSESRSVENIGVE